MVAAHLPGGVYISHRPHLIMAFEILWELSFWHRGRRTGGLVACSFPASAAIKLSYDIITPIPAYFANILSPGSQWRGDIDYSRTVADFTLSSSCCSPGLAADIDEGFRPPNNRN